MNEGTPEARLTKLLEELNKRFPNVSQVMSDPIEPKYLAEIDRLIDQIVMANFDLAISETPLIVLLGTKEELYVKYVIDRSWKSKIEKFIFEKLGNV